MIGLLVAVAGSCGAVARFTLDGALRARLGSAFPWATIVINVTGSLLLGLLAGLVAGGGPPALLTVVGVGFCGGYTTFSTASVESVTLLRAGRPVAAAGNAALSLVVCGAAAALGLALARLL